MMVNTVPIIRTSAVMFAGGVLFFNSLILWGFSLPMRMVFSIINIREDE
uniref:Uncharacterized protein n=1 Tax=Rhizophora mucronata TaxID=61149 RepID=A0A2P2PV24_RHIMU